MLRHALNVQNQQNVQGVPFNLSYHSTLPSSVSVAQTCCPGTKEQHTIEDLLIHLEKMVATKRRRPGRPSSQSLARPGLNPVFTLKT